MTTMPIQIDPERLEQLSTLHLDAGDHDSFEQGHCAMEAVSWLLNQPHSDAPECVDGLVAQYVRELNDALTDTERQRLIALVPGIAATTRGDSSRIHRVFTQESTGVVRRWGAVSGYTDDDFDPKNGRSIALCESLATQVARTSGDERAAFYALLVTFTMGLMEYFSHYPVLTRLLPSTSLAVSYVKHAHGHLAFDPSIHDELESLIADHPAFEGYRRVRALRVDDALGILSRLIGTSHV